MIIECKLKIRLRLILKLKWRWQKRCLGFDGHTDNEDKIEDKIIFIIIILRSSSTDSIALNYFFNIYVNREDI